MKSIATNALRVATGYDRGESAEASCVRFLASMEEKYRLLMRAGGGPLVGWGKDIVEAPEAEVVAMAVAGQRLDDICRASHRGVAAVRKILHRHGVMAKGMHGKGCKRTRERREAGMRMLAEGQSQSVVAFEMRVSKPTAFNWRRRLDAMSEAESRELILGANR